MKIFEIFENLVFSKILNPLHPAFVTYFINEEFTPLTLEKCYLNRSNHDINTKLKLKLLYFYYFLLFTVNRLYTEEAWNKLPENISPEMQRSDLGTTVLQLKALGVDNVLRFDYPSPPPSKNLISALELLFALGALKEDGELTENIGYKMAEMSIEPMLARILLQSGKFYIFL